MLVCHEERLWWQDVLLMVKVRKSRFLDLTSPAFWVINSSLLPGGGLHFICGYLSMGCVFCGR